MKQCSAVIEARWGSITPIHLPGGGLGIYQAKHPMALGLS
jgi:hypothetical protein